MASEAASSSDKTPPTDTAEQSTEGAAEDADMKLLKARRMLELRRKVNSTILAQKQAEEEKAHPKKKPPSDREVLTSAFRERADEVLAAAEGAYPRETAILIPRLASLVREGKVSVVTGGELLQLFRSIGMRVSVPTSISVQQHGKFMSLSDKLKQDVDRD